MADIIALFVALLLLVVLAVSLYKATFVLDFLAEKGIFITKVKTGTYMFVVRGDTLDKVLADIPGKKVIYDEGEGRYKTVDDPTPPSQGWWTRFWSIYHWVGIYPLFKIKKYKFRWRDFPTQKDLDENRKAPHSRFRDEWTKYLYYEKTYPFESKPIELKDGTKVIFFGTITVETCDPVKPVFVLDGAWFEQVRSAVSGAISDRVRKKTYPELQLDIVKGGPSSKLQEAALKANEDKPGRGRKVSQPGTGLGVLSSTGVKLVSFEFEDYESTKTEGQEKVEAAQRAKELAIMEGDADVEAAKREKDATTIRGEGEAAAIRAKLAAANGDVSVLNTNSIADAVRRTKVPGTVLINFGDPEKGKPQTVLPVGVNR